MKLQLNLHFTLFEFSLFLFILLSQFVIYFSAMSWVSLISWDGLKLYLPLAKLFYETKSIPNYDPSFNGGQPIGWSIFFPFLISLLYGLNGGVNEHLAFILSPIFSTLSVFLVYLIASKRFGKLFGLLSATVLSITPMFVVFSSVPYTDVCLLFFFLFYIYCLENEKFFGFSFIPLMIMPLIKYQGFLVFLIPIVLLILERKYRNIRMFGLLILGAIPGSLLLVRNYFLFHNPLPFMALPVKLFENPPEAFYVLHNEGVMQLRSPFESFIFFFVSSFFVISICRVLTMFSVFNSLSEDSKFKAYYTFFLILFFVVIVSGELDIRNFLFAYPLVIFSIVSLTKSLFEIPKSHFKKVLSFSLLLIPVFFASDTMTIMYAFSNYWIQLLLLLLLSFILFFVEPKFKGQFKIDFGIAYLSALEDFTLLLKPKAFLLIFIILVSSLFFIPKTEPRTIIQTQQPYWQNGFLGLVDYAHSLNTNESFLLIEEPGLRYLAGVNSYELTDTYGSIKLAELMDKPNSFILFFGDNEFRTRTQTSVICGLNNTNHDEAIVFAGGELKAIFSNISPSEYSLIINHRFSGVISGSDAEGRTFNLTLHDYEWKTTVLKIYVSTRLELTFFADSDSYLRFVLLFPDVKPDLDVLREHNIRYVVLPNHLVHVWVFKYYSLFSYLYLPESQNDFERIYLSDYWSLYKLR